MRLNINWSRVQLSKGYYNTVPPAEMCTASVTTGTGPVPANGSAAREGVYFTDLTHRPYLHWHKIVPFLVFYSLYGAGLASSNCAFGSHSVFMCFIQFSPNSEYFPEENSCAGLCNTDLQTKQYMKRSHKHTSSFSRICTSPFCVYLIGWFNANKKSILASKFTIQWNVTPCGLVNLYQRFGAMLCFRVQDCFPNLKIEAAVPYDKRHHVPGRTV